MMPARSGCRQAAIRPDEPRAKSCKSTPEIARFEAALEILEPPGLARCRTCGGDVELERPFGRCGCGSTDLDWIAGEELKVREMEVV